MAEEKKIEGFSNIKFTASGLLLEAKLKTGVPLKITRAVIGTGYLDDGEDVANLTALKSEIESHQTGVTSSSATVDITNVSVVAAGMTNLRLKIKNGDTPFYLREIGIMAQDPDLGESFLLSIIYILSVITDVKAVLQMLRLLLPQMRISHKLYT